jgi:phosphoglycerate dehydrogenase-like enzyme
VSGSRSWTDRPNVLISHASMGPALLKALGDRVSARLLDSPAALDPARQAEIPGLREVDTIIGFHFPPDALAGLPNLRWLHLTGTGTEHLPATGLRPGVLVTNSPRVAVEPVAEYALTGLLACLKDIASLGERPSRRPWFGASARMLSGSTVGVLGAGRIGSAVIRRLTALGARCVAFTRTGSPPVPDVAETVASTELESRGPGLDALVCCLPATAATDGLVGVGTLAALPPHAVVVNVGRASSIDVGALYRALRDRRLRGAFLDVHAAEPLPSDDEAWDVPGLIVSPHCGFAFPDEALEVTRGFFDNLGDLVAGKAPRDRVRTAPVAPAVTATRPPAAGESGGDRFAAARDQFTRSLAEEARLRAGDDRIVAAAVEHSTAILADVAAARAADPPRPIESPVIVIGMLRTGTTLLHNLLNLHPRLHGPALWELAEPAVAGGDPAAHPAAIERAQAYVDEYNRKSPDFAAIHYLQADRPDECHRLLANTFHSMVLEMRYRVPSYGDWLRRQDHDLAYAEHRRQLEVLMRGNVDAEGAPLTPVLKCPFHTWYLPAVTRAYPGARYVHLHRDPVEAIASTASLCQSVRRARTDHVDLAEIGAQWRDRIVPLAESLSADRADLLGGRPVLDIRFRDLTADPAGTVERVCAFLGLDADADFLAAVRGYLEHNGRTSHGTHRYTPEQFGLDSAALSRATARYSRRFAL